VITSANPGGGAAAWTVSNLVFGFVTINDVSCPSVTLCVVVDTNGSVWWSNDPNGGASTWTEEAGIYGGAGGLQEVDCPTTTLCVISTGSGGFVGWSANPTGGTGTWSLEHIDGTNAEFSLDCPTTTLCVTGNDAGGINWTHIPTGIDTDWTNVPGVGFGVLEGLSCVNETFCVGSDDSGNIATSTNPIGAASAWTLTTFPFVTMWSISCPVTTLCVATAGTSARSSVNPLGGAAAWSDDLLGTTLRAASCASAAFCVVGGNSGNIYVGRQATLAVTRAGTGTGSVTGSGIACPGTCSFVYPLGTPVTLTATPGSDGSTFTGWSGNCTGTGDCVLSMGADRAVTATFTAPVATQSAAPDPTPTPQGPTTLPPPVQRQSANAYPASGTVLVRPAGGKTFVPLTRPSQVQFGAVFDARKGAVTIVIANSRGGLDTATFSEGQFRLVAAGAIAELQLVGGNFKGCPKPAKGGAAAAGASRGRNVRHLWGTGSGSFRTKGRFAAATVRGTKWLTDDYCRGTLIKVAVGAVTVRDLVKRKTLALEAPKNYFAGPRA
jgi:hypothetical protein